jgi:hypothetical protein
MTEVYLLWVAGQHLPADAPAVLDVGAVGGPGPIEFRHSDFPS